MHGLIAAPARLEHFRRLKSYLSAKRQAECRMGVRIVSFGQGLEGKRPKGMAEDSPRRLAASRTANATFAQAARGEPPCSEAEPWVHVRKQGPSPRRGRQKPQCRGLCRPLRGLAQGRLVDPRLPKPRRGLYSSASFGG